MSPITCATVGGALALLIASTAAAAQPAKEPAVSPPSKPAPIVFFDIAAPELDKQAAFYREAFGWQADKTGAFSVPVASPLPGNLRVEPSEQGPVTERLIYVGVPDVTAAQSSDPGQGGRDIRYAHIDQPFGHGPLLGRLDPQIARQRRGDGNGEGAGLVSLPPERLTVEGRLLVELGRRDVEEHDRRRHVTSIG